MNVLEGKLTGAEDIKIGIVAARFNEFIVSRLIGGARETYSAAESREGDVFGPETFALAMSRVRQAQGLPRDAPRETDSANSPSAFQK